jgi:dTDP-4-amino-4,6-dideoxygalactose transaminase
MAVPFVDLNAQYSTIKDRINAAIQSVIDRNSFIGGEDTKNFEVEFAKYCEVGGCVGVGNGTDALHLALRAFGIGVGDEVITVSHTFIASAEAISAVGAKPIFIDIRSDTMLMNVEFLERAITPRTKAIVAVHLYGQPCDMDEILAVARRCGLRVISDCAQAHGARWNGRNIATLGDAACFSFYPGKNLGAYGDAGAVVSNDLAFLKHVRMLANHGRLEKYRHEIVGYNSRLDGLQAAILRVKLEYLAQWTKARQQNARYYLDNIRAAGVQLPVVSSRADAVWHLFVVRCKNRDALQARLKENGIETGVHYPIPLHLQPAYKLLEVPAGSLPESEQAANTVLSLPMYAEMRQQQLDQVCGVLNSMVM